MKKNLSLAFGLVFMITLANAQKSSDKAVNESCACVKKISKTAVESEQTKAAMTCFATSVGKYQAELKKEFNITTKDENEANSEIGKKLGASIAQKCPEMVPHLINMAKMQSAKSVTEGKADINPDTLKLDNAVCALYKNGKYVPVKMYANRKVIENTDPTSYTEVKDGFVYDYEMNKTLSTKWSIKWVNACEWEQTLLESNSPNINAVFKIGEKVNMRAIGSTKDKKLYFISKMMGMEIIGLIKKQ